MVSCDICGGQILRGLGQGGTPFKRCSAECDAGANRRAFKKQWRPVPPTRYRCEDCDAEGTGTAGRRLCEQCAERRGRGCTASRCRYFGVPYDPAVTRAAVLKRDGMYCQQCDVAVVDGVDHTADNAAEVDHVVPLSAGILGHAWDNVQVLCRRCNRKKHATVPSEWRDQHPLWTAAEVVA